MDRRRKPRAVTALPVRVWGLDSNSYPFMQLAMVRNVSEKGVLLNGLTCQLRPGAVVDLQYNGRKAEFLVVWVAPGSSGEVGLQKLQSEPVIWDGFFDRMSAMPANV